MRRDEEGAYVCRGHVMFVRHETVEPAMLPNAKDRQRCTAVRSAEVRMVSPCTGLSQTLDPTVNQLNTVPASPPIVFVSTG